MADALDRLLDNLTAQAAHPCLFENGRWRRAGELAAAVADWRTVIGAQAPRAGAVMGLQAGFGFDPVACLLAAWQMRLIVALLPPGAPAADTARLAHCDLGLRWDEGGAHWMARQETRHEPLLESLRASGDAGAVIFTSGSTGQPRAAVHALPRLLARFSAGGRALRTLAVLQMDHIAGLDALLYTLCAGGGFVIPRNRTPAAVCSAIAAARVEVLSASPSFLRLLCFSDAARDADFSSIAIVTYGSEPMDPATLARVNALFPGCRISQKYGTTELGAPRTASEANDSLWIRFAGTGVDAQVRDGVLWMRTPSQFIGYLDEPSPFDAEGWYCTGDRVECRDGWMRILGRERELISVGGEKVAPQQVEAVILEMPDVLAAAVCGEPNALLGAVVVARVELEGGASAEDAERRIRQHCRSRLPPYQVPVRIELTDGLMGPRQKLRRRGRDATPPGAFQNW